MAVQFSIPVSNVFELTALGYTKIEVWRTADKGNSYQETTASTATAASLTSSHAQNTFDMNGGKLLKFKVNGGTEVSITFSGTPVRYWTPTQVANRINLTTNIATVVDGCVVLTSGTTGRASTIEITYNDANDLGWVAGQTAVGLAARITLVNGTYIYTYTDLAGVSTYKYKWRFSANGVNPISEYSTPVLGSASPFSVPIALGTATFMNSAGLAVKTTVIVSTDYGPHSVSGYSMINNTPILYESDALGFLQIPFVQGATVRVGIEGTALVREFVVPATNTFDLMSVLANEEDPFTVQTPAPLLTRRTV